WSLILDTKTSRIVSLPASWAALKQHLGALGRVLNEDLPWPLLAVGLLGLLFAGRKQRKEQNLLLFGVALVYILLGLVIWEGRVSDALLAVKLPTVLLAVLGLGFSVEQLIRYGSPFLQMRIGNIGALLLLIGGLYFYHRPLVLEITRDPSAESVVAQISSLDFPQDGRPVTFMALWGHDYWALTYAQKYEGKLAGYRLVDHNADFPQILKRGDHLLTLSKTFYQRPLSWWGEKLGAVYLSSVAPGVLEISNAPILSRVEVPPGPQLDLGNGVRILSSQIKIVERQIYLTIYWEAQSSLVDDYSVAVHLLAHNPPRGPEDVLSQADRRHPVDGWYPTSRWRPGEVIRDDYLITIPMDKQPVGVRVGMYRVDERGQFINTSWLFLPLK
ncbi:MAG: hypothetical protein J7M05_10380, partial [Anaerolineae bacterium]|nr:hypothetical protein [Anaerolineae bacterium]